MEKSGHELADDFSAAEQALNVVKIQQCNSHLIHACNCRDADCMSYNCKQMKKIVKHIRECRTRMIAVCALCRTFIAVCCYHAKHCQETECLVPFCKKIKDNLKRNGLIETQPPCPSLGTIGTNEPGQMANNNDMVPTEFTNPGPSNPSILSELQNQVNQELGLSTEENVHRAHQELDKDDENL